MTIMDITTDQIELITLHCFQTKDKEEKIIRIETGGNYYEKD
ncbi:hypothetical protein [Paenibacillus mendelii]|uniref:Uncharacterized protein n=1 Tax=Paenibacillus mendelii TaxID=206163 RepID=A0ABV6J7I8_9BACL|nr:hypothetical protein [Paenibacillus mendelii]MCQ6562195.1 hypothetical protein [Paenibacillus mendelii]